MTTGLPNGPPANCSVSRSLTMNRSQPRNFRGYARKFPTASTQSSTRSRNDVITAFRHGMTTKKRSAGPTSSTPYPKTRNPPLIRHLVEWRKSAELPQQDKEKHLLEREQGNRGKELLMCRTSL